MTSNDNYITVEMFNDGLNRIEEKIITLTQDINQLNQRFDKLENLVMTEIRVNETAHSYLQTSIYWGFAIIAFVVAFVGLYPFKREKTENATQQKETLTEARVEKIAETIAEKVMSKALAGISIKN